MLHFSPTSHEAGYQNDVDASWGGNVVLVDGVYHMFVAEFANSCPLAYWGTNSMIVRAESNSPAGPFTFREVIVNTFSHNPTGVLVIYIYRI